MPTPSRTWFPVALQDQAAWYQNFSNQFGPLATTLGFLPATVTAVNADRDDLVFCASATIEVTAYGKSFRQYRNILLKGAVGVPATNFPTNPTLNPPSQVATGIFQRLDELVARIRVAPAYNDDIGAALGIVPVTPVKPDPATTPPVLKAEAMPSSTVAVTFVRGAAAGIEVEVRVDNESTWTDAGLFVKSPANLKIPVNTQNLPRAVQIRARYVEGNSPVGQFSDVVTAITQPASS